MHISTYTYIYLFPYKVYMCYHYIYISDLCLHISCPEYIYYIFKIKDRIDYLYVLFLVFTQIKYKGKVTYIYIHIYIIFYIHK